MKKLELRTVLMLLSVVGLGITAYCASKDGEKLKDMKDNASITKKPLDKKAVAKNYIRTGLAAAATTFCIVKSHNLSTTEIAAITATATYVTANRDYLEKKLKEHVPEEKLKEIKDEFLQTESIKQVNRYPAEETGNGDTLFFEAYSGRAFRSSYEAVDQAIITFKRMFEGYDGADRDYVCLNDFYELLKIKQTHFGYEFGWAPNEDFFDNEIVFEVTKMEPPKLLDDQRKLQMLGYEDIDEEFYMIELCPACYPAQFWQQV